MNIEFQNSIVSGKGIFQEDVSKIIEAGCNLNYSSKQVSIIKEQDNNYNIDQGKIHYEFWDKFVNESFSEMKFKHSFNKRKPWEKSYYDLFWKINYVHLCLRHNIRDNYVAVEVYIEDNKDLYKYIFRHKEQIEKLYGHSLNFVEAIGKDGQTGKASKVYDKYNCGEICDRSTWNEYIIWLKNTSLKMKEIIEYVIDEFSNNYVEDKDNNYLINEELPYEREVISIPASGTIDLIYKYRVHAHPNTAKGYSYKKALFYTFRENAGVMTRLYELNRTIILNPENISYIDNLGIDKFSKERLKGYIENRKKTFGFSKEEYKFYILNESIELINKVSLPKQNNHAYFTLKEIYSGKDIINRSNEVTINNREKLFDIIKKNSNIDYTELEDENVELDVKIVEGEKVFITKEVKKRNSLARRLKLEDFKKKHGKVYCEVCGIDDELVLDVHHDKIKVADMDEHHETKLDDLRVVCANCHRKVHGLNITVDKLIYINN
ncbi:DUF4268 domain-containing protein [Clostridium sp.]|uniref:DUF4268 domain-containing protein n=1 Tax=Clostridium sp. TaxID=1506 RepID=UPI001B71631D|nr:DUF4268 domain-containing protein [Clostridium sp.]MBP3916974.1 DUF4268 domain-containing protein [Clostridium sp.]